METTKYAFDGWGNSTQAIQPTGVQIDREYYPPAGETDHCPSDPHGFQRYITSITVMPAPSTYNTPTKRCQMVDSQLPTAAAAPYDASWTYQRSSPASSSAERCQGACYSISTGQLWPYDTDYLAKWSFSKRFFRSREFVATGKLSIDEYDRLIEYQCQGPQYPANEKGLQLQR